ncbi:MAG: glycosyltransferase family 4 protein, partial [Verrucomicrobia bacterium]|nr:glycosyltransferase family 4 protein [Verrucomicrobiota bacterium]
MDLLHEDYSESISWKDRLWRRLNLKKLAISRAQFQVPSEFTRQRLQTVYRIPHARIFRTYLPIHDRLRSGNRRQTTPFFFYPARPWKHKNHHNLLRAFQRYRERTGTAAWRLVLTAGNDQLTCDLRRLAGELNLSSHVDFIGDVSEEQLADYYQSATALVFPSYYEGFGIPLLEAMHFGLPIICGRGGSQAEIAGDAALYVEVGNIEELAEAMRRISCDADLRRQLADTGRRRLAHFTWRPEVQALADAFKQAAGGAHAGHPIGRMFRHAFLAGFDLIYAVVAAFTAVLNLTKRRDAS